MENEKNQNCRGCGAFITRVICPYCGKHADIEKDKVTPDKKDDPKRNVKLGKLYL